jgi:MFS family permease
MKAGGIGVSSRAANWTLAALFAMNLLNYIDRFILAAVLGPVQESLHIENDMAKAGFLTTIFFVSYAIFSPVVGILGDRMPRKYLLAIGIGIWSLATFGSGLVYSYGEMVAARSVLGIGEAAYATLAPALIGDLFPRAKRNRALAIFYIAIPIGAALGYVIGGAINAHHEKLHILPLVEQGLSAITGRQFADGKGWRLAFFVVGVPGLLVAIFALLLPEPQRGGKEGVDEADLAHMHTPPLAWKTYSTLLHNRSYVYNTLGMAMFTFALGGLQSWTPKYLTAGENEAVQRADEENKKELDETHKKALEAANQGLGLSVLAAGLIGTPLGAWLADRFARRFKGAYFWVSGVAMIIAAPFILIALVTARYGGPNPVIFGSIAIGLILSFLNYGPSNAIIINVTVPNLRAAAFAINIFLIHFLGDIPSPSAMGAVADLTRSLGWAADDKTSLFWGLSITIPAMLLSGLFFCLGGPHLEADQDAVIKELKSAPKTA